MKYRLFSSRLSWPVMFLLVMLQRSPVVRFIAEIEFSLLPRVQHLWAVVAGAVTVGAYNSVTAASGDLRLRSGFDDTTVTVGEQLRVVIEIEGDSLTPEDWDVNGVLPEGVTATTIVNAATAVIDGTPTEVGSWEVTVKAWQDRNMGGDEATPVSFTIQVESFINQQPQSQAIDFGSSGELLVSVNNPEGVTYQWQKQNAENLELYDDLEGQTNSTLSLSTVDFDDEGRYRVVVTKGEIVTISDEVMVTVNPLITEHPVNQVADWGGSAELFVQLAISDGATYQWQKQNAENPELYDDLLGQTGAVLSFTNAFSSDAGVYRVVATVGIAMQVSSAATLDVNATPFEIWKDTFFEDPFDATAALDLDPDEDMLINAVEFTFGLNPLEKQKEALMDTTHEVIDGVTFAVLSFPAVLEGVDSTIAVETNARPDVDGWTELQNGVNGVMIESTVDAYVVKIPAAQRSFNRLRIVSN